MNSEWVKGSLLLAATLSAGIAIGVWLGRTDSPADNGSHVAAMQMDQQHVMHMLHQALKLDSVQHRAIIATLHRHQSMVDSAWGALRPHVNATLDSTHAEIMNLLRPEQRQVFRQLISHGHGGSLQ